MASLEMPAEAKGSPFSLSAAHGLGSSEAPSDPPAHAVEHMQRTRDQAEAQRTDELNARLFGSHMPERLRLERAIAGRMASDNIPLSFSYGGSQLASDISTGRGAEIRMEDVLGKPQNSPMVGGNSPGLVVHEVMQHRLKL
jgi:Proteasome maturation factor UMP1